MSCYRVPSAIVAHWARAWGAPSPRPSLPPPMHRLGLSLGLNLYPRSRTDYPQSSSAPPANSDMAVAPAEAHAPALLAPPQS